MSDPAVSVLIAVSEGAEDLRELHAELASAVGRLGGGVELLYLLAGAGADAARQALELRAEDPERVRVLRFARPVGEAAALATGFARARGEVIFTLPGRFDADLRALEGLYDALLKGADLAFASRRGRNGTRPDRLRARLFDRLASWATGTHFVDLASPTRAVRRSVADELPLQGEFQRFLPALAHRLGFAVAEVPAQIDPRASGARARRARSSLGILLDTLSVFFLVHFTRRPLRLFGTVGTLFSAVGGGILVWLAFERLALDQALAGRPMLVLGTLLLGIGVQAFTIGLLGELLVFFHARELPGYRVSEIDEPDPPPLAPRPERRPGDPGEAP